MTETMHQFLLDNNALFQLTRAQRQSPRFRSIVRLPGAVIDEAGDAGRNDGLGKLEYRMTGRVLRHLKAIMATVEPGDTSLVDLYKYEGTADPILVACVLAEEEQAHEGLLIPVRWTVVTGDKAVIATCERFGVDWCSAASFAAHLDAAD